MKKTTYFIVTIVSALSILFSSTQTHAATQVFKDVPITHPSSEAIQWAASKKLVGGYEDGTFRPSALLTEAQFVAILTRYYAVFQEEALRYGQLDQSMWSNSLYEALARYKVPLLGYEEKMYRNQPLKRGLLAQVLAYVNGQSSTLENAIQYMFNEKITTGQTAESTTLLEKYGVQNHLTRAQAVVFFHRLATQGKTELHRNVVSKKVVADVDSAQAKQAKEISFGRVDQRVKPINRTQYIEGQKLPAKPTYIKGILLANKQLPLPKDFVPGESTVARAQFTAMAAEAKEAGIQLTAFSTYRSYNYQANLYVNYVKRDGKVAADRYSARPGYSEHQTGLAFDIGAVNETKHWATASFGQTKAGMWVAAHAHHYGFIMRYPQGKETLTGYMPESWHFRYVGKEAAKIIYKNAMTLEEYVGI